MAFHLLPLEIVLIIWQFLDTNDINSLCQTCQVLYKKLNFHLYRIASKAPNVALEKAVLKDIILATGRSSTKKGRKVRMADLTGRSPLSWIAASGKSVLMKLLLATGTMDVNEEDFDGRSSLSWAAATGGPEVMEILLATDSVKLDQRDRQGRSPLSWAAESGDCEVVRRLLTG